MVYSRHIIVLFKTATTLSAKLVLRVRAGLNDFQILTYNSLISLTHISLIIILALELFFLELL